MLVEKHNTWIALDRVRCVGAMSIRGEGISVSDRNGKVRRWCLVVGENNNRAEKEKNKGK